MITSKYNGYIVNLIESVDELDNAISTFNPSTHCGVDTETTGLSYTTDYIVGICISGGKSYSPEDYKGYYIPLRHESYDKNLPVKPVIDRIQFIIDKFKTVFFNRGYDFTMLEKEGLKCPYVGKTHDAQIMAHLATNESFPSLKEFAKKYLHFDVIDFSSNKAVAGNFGTTDPTTSYVYGCFSPETKFMTKHGWKKFDDIELDEEIAQWNPATDSIEFVIPSVRMKLKNKPLMKFFNRRLSMEVTPNHRVYSKVGQKWVTVEASELKYKRFGIKTYYDSYPGTPINEFKIGSKVYPSVLIMKLLGYLLCNPFLKMGHFFIRNHFCEEEKSEWVRSLIDSLDINFVENKQNTITLNYVIKDNSIISFVKQSLLNDGAVKIPDFVINSSIEERRAFIEGIFMNLGILTDRKVKFNFFDKSIAEQVLFLVNTLGKTSTLEKLGTKLHNVYELNIFLEKKYVIVNPSDSDFVEYVDDAVCFQVPSSYLVVQNNYTTYISGNCQDPIITVLLARKLWSNFPYIRKIYPLDNKVSEAMRWFSITTELYLNHEFLEKELQNLNKKLSEIKNKIYNFVGYQFNLNSSVDKADAISRYTSLTKKTSTGRFAVDKETLATIDHPLAKMFLEYSSIETLRHSFVQKLQSFPEKIRINYSTVNVSCLTENNFIRTNQGLKSIRDVSVGMQVETRYGFKEVLFTNFYKDKVFRVNTEFEEYFIEGNGKHPIFTSQGWKTISELSVNDEVLTLYHNQFTLLKITEIIPLGEDIVYNIEVADVHEFVANNIVTHNTGRLSSGSSPGNDFFANLNIQNIPKTEVFRSLWRDDTLGYTVKDKSSILIEGDGKEAEMYELELEDGRKICIDGEASVLIERDGKLQYSQVKNLLVTDSLKESKSDDQV